MESISIGRSDRKHKALLAATEVFLSKGYDRTSMDEVAAKAAISKPTVYKYFSDKENLFAEIARAATGEMEDLLRLVVETMAGTANIEPSLTVLARRFISALTQPNALRVRRLVMANAERFPNIGRSWYEQGFGRVVESLAVSFQDLADRKLLHVNDSLQAASHFVGMLLWTPINKAMFTADVSLHPEELDGYAVATVRAFLAGYGPTSGSRRSSAHTSNCPITK